MKNSAVGIILFLLAGGCDLRAETFIIWSRLNEDFAARHLARLALEKTKKEYGPFQLKDSTPLEQGRGFTLLKQAKSLHIMSGAADPTREKEFLPIRVPAQQGLLGYRVCLIRKGEQQKFDGIRNLQKWQKRGLTIGQGTHWPDTAILRANRLPIVVNPTYLRLFDMLKKGRFDCFARAASEVIAELKEHGEPKALTLEKNLVFAYRMPDFLWVSKKTPRLAQRLQLGAERAVSDGSFQMVIDRLYGEAFEILKNRQLIKLQNPYLTNETMALESREELYFYGNFILSH